MFDHTNGNNSFQLNLTLYYTITSRDRKNTPQVYLNFKLKKNIQVLGDYQIMGTGIFNDLKSQVLTPKGICVL